MTFIDDVYDTNLNINDNSIKYNTKSVDLQRPSILKKHARKREYYIQYLDYYILLYRECTQI